MNQKPAICLGCGGIRYLQYGNPKPHGCGDNRIIWVMTTVEEAREKIQDKAKIAGIELKWQE